MRAGVVRLQARMRGAGLPWYGGRPPGLKTVRGRMAAALRQGELALTVVEELPATGALEDLNRGTRAGLRLAIDTVGLVQAELDRDGAKADIKLLRLGNEAAMNLARLSMRAAENEFQRRKGDAVERLLEAIAAEKSTK